MRRKLVTLTLLLLLSGSVFAATFVTATPLIEKLLASVLTVTLAYAVFTIAIEELFARRVSDAKRRYGFRKAVSLFFLLTVLVVLLRVWVPNPEALLVAYGVAAAGIAIALQDLIKNMAGSISVFINGHFQVGNRVKINNVIGDVIDIGLFNTTLLETGEWIDADQATGRITTIPNGVVLSQPVYNYTRHHKYLWDELTAVVTSESNWEEAMRLLGEIGHEHTKAFVEEAEQSLTKLERYYYVEGHVLEPNVYIKPATDGYGLTLRYVVNAWQRRSTSSDIWEHMLRVFEEHPEIFIAPSTYAVSEYPLPKTHKRKTKKT